MPKIDESDLDVGNEPPFVARKVVIKRGQNPKLDYAFSDELGRGRFGTVVKCTEKRTGLALAAKFVSTRLKEERENVEREVDIMKSLQHRRLLQLYDVYDDGASEICIITELINGGELFERVIDDDFELTEKVCAIFMRQIIEGVQYMHEKFIMHLDMKPENILCVTLTGNRIKLIDFGLARRFDPSQTLQVMFGTPDFAAPEVLSYERVTPAADMWSVGVICYVLLSGLSPFMGNSDLETMTNVTRAVYDFDDESFDPITQEARDFIAKLLIKDPRKRLTPAQCLQHKWLAKTPAKRGKAPQLDKTKLKKYVVRRRWQKAVTAIMALSRMGANLSLTGPGARSTSGSAATAKRSSALNSTRTPSSTRTTTSKAPRTTKIGTSSSTSTTTSRTSSSVVPPRVTTIGGAGSPSPSPSTTTTTNSRLSGSPNLRTTITTHTSSSTSPTNKSASRFTTSSSSTSSSSSNTTTRSPVLSSLGTASQSSLSSSQYRVQSTSSTSTTRRKY